MMPTTSTFLPLPACPQRGTAFLETDAHGDRTVWFEDMMPHGHEGRQTPGVWLVITAKGVRLAPRTTGWTTHPLSWPALDAMFADDVAAKAAKPTAVS